MRVDEIIAVTEKRKFEPFAFTITIQSEDEALELFHRFNVAVGKLGSLYNDGVPPKWHFLASNCGDILKLLDDKVKYYDLEP